MWSTQLFIVLLILQGLFITDITGNASRRRRRRRQTSGSLYGTNANLGASAPAGYNYPASTNIQGIRLNNADARDLYGNPIISSSNTQNSLSSVDMFNQPRPQQQQVYGTNDQASSSSLYSGNNFYSGSNTNQLLRDPYGNQIMRDTNGNPISSGSAGSSFYSSSNNQMAYPPNSNQVLTNKDLYGTVSNTNNNQYGSSGYVLPNSNTYGGQMGSSSLLLPNNNAYSGQTGGSGGSNLVPNSNTYSGYRGTDSNNNAWSNTNGYNQYNQNSANSWYPNKDTSYNNNNNNNANRYGSSNSNPYYYNDSYRLSTSYLIIFLSFGALIISQ